MTEFICGMVVASILAMPAMAQSVTPSAIRIHNETLDGSVLDVLGELANKYHVVIGIYGASAGSGESGISITMSEGTLAELFDAIVKADPRLIWKRTERGTIHFLYRDRPLSLFDVAVRSFHVEKARRSEISGRLEQMPEVSAWLRSHGCSMVDWIAGVNVKRKESRDFDLHLEGVALPAVFDEIAARSGTYFWYAIQTRSSPCEISVRP